MRWLLFLAVAFVGCVEPRLDSIDAGADAGPVDCSPLNCTGCCLDNECVGGNQNDACGYDGRQCRVCGTGTSCLSPGACFADPRDAGFREPNPDAGGFLNDPLTGQPLGPPRAKCVFVFGRFFCS